MQSAECSHLCMLLRNTGLSSPAIGTRIASFLEPHFPPFADIVAIGGGSQYEAEDGSGSGFVSFHESKEFKTLHNIVLPEPISGVAFSPCCSRLAIGDSSGAVRLIEMGTMSVTGSRLGGGMARVAFAPSGRLLAVGNYCGQIFILNPKTLAIQHSVYADPQSRGDDGGVMSLEFSPSGDRLAVGCFGGMLRFFEPRSVTELRSFPLEGSDAFVTYHPSGMSVAVCILPRADYLDGHFLQLLNVQSGSVLCEEVHFFSRQFHHSVYMTYTPAGTQLMVTFTGFPLRVFDSGTLELLREIDIGCLVRSIAFVDHLDEAKEEGRGRPHPAAPTDSGAHLVIQPVAHDEPAAEANPVDDARASEELWASGVEALQGQQPAGSGSGGRGRRVLLLAFSRCSPELDEALLESGPAERARGLGVELQPAWAHGAKVFVEGIGPELVEPPLAERLLPSNVFVREEDQGDVLAALEHLPVRVRKQKPGDNIVPDRLSLLSVSSVPGTTTSDDRSLLNASSASSGCVEDEPERAVEITVVNTFVHFHSSADTRTVVSAPAHI